MLPFLIILLIALVTYFAFSKKFKAKRKSYSEGINFYFTLIATIIGVSLAIYISEYQQEKSTDEYVKDMLSNAISNVEFHIDRNNGFINNVYKVTQLDSLNVSFNKLGMPLYAEQILFMDSKIGQRMNSSIYQALLKDFEEAKQFQDVFHTNGYRNSSAIAEQSVEKLKVIQQKIKLEIKLQNNQLNERLLDNELTKIETSYDSLRANIYKKPMVIQK